MTWQTSRHLAGCFTYLWADNPGWYFIGDTARQLMVAERRGQQS